MTYAKFDDPLPFPHIPRAACFAGVWIEALREFWYCAGGCDGVKHQLRRDAK